jgi:hypothetical protein
MASWSEEEQAFKHFLEEHAAVSKQYDDYSYIIVI